MAPNSPLQRLLLLIFLAQITATAMSVQRAKHLVVLVHGWLGNDNELGYLQETLERQAGDNNKNIIFHSAKCNLGRTTDGIAKGGQRLAVEIEEQIQQHSSDGSIKLSIVGNSLGGLYARYAIAHISDWTGVIPLIFCTTATPHLGVSNHTYIPIPGWTKSVIGNVLQDTGRDLFCLTPLVYDMATTDFYREPLKAFRDRILMANAFGTDFQVPTSTAGFLSKTSTYVHKTLSPSNNDVYLLSLKTEPNQPHNPNDTSESLDALGWTKIFVDVRDAIPLPALPLLFSKPATIPQDRTEWTSQELYPTLSTFGDRWTLPVGHTISCANARNDFYSWFNSNGRPIMDQLAADLLRMMNEAEEGESAQCESAAAAATTTRTET